MRSDVTAAALVGGVVLMGWTVGQRSNPAGDVSSGQHPARVQAVRALDHLERRLAAVPVSTAASTNREGEGVAGEVRRLRVRVIAVRAKVDSLSVQEEAHRGAWAGIRASIADLEYRTDIAVLTVHEDATSFTTAFVGMVTETQAQLEAVRRSLTPQARLDHGARLDSMSEELGRMRRDAEHRAVEQRRFPADREDAARRLAHLRRELRAIARSLERTVAGPVRERPGARSGT